MSAGAFVVLTAQEEWLVGLRVDDELSSAEYGDFDYVKTVRIFSLCQFDSKKGKYCKR